MFEQAYKATLALYTSKDSLPEKYWQEIVGVYSAPGRHYHTLAHLEDIYTKLLPVQNQISNWAVLMLSIAYHDYVYNILSKHNEEKSADLARSKLNRIGVPVLKIESCRQQILATIDHKAVKDPDTNYFTDADLAILGADPNSYLQYTKDIRKEYYIYPSPLFKAGRRKVVKHFLGMERIFKTNYFYEQFEAQARFNLSRELEWL